MVATESVLVLQKKAETDVEIIDKAGNLLGRIILWIIKETLTFTLS